MNPFEELSEYLRTKVAKVNPNNPKANTGAVLLRLFDDFEGQVDRFVAIAFQTIQMRFTYDTSDSPAGTAPLTVISMAIGQRINKIIQREPLPWNSQIRLGDLFVEAFYNLGYLDIYYPKRRDSSYILSATAKWIDLADIPEALKRITLHATSTTRIPNISQIIQGDGEPVIKGWTEEDNPAFAEHLSAIWVGSINKLQQTGWRINQPVYEALIANKDLFISDDPIEDNEVKEMKRRSKMVEWAFIMSKAEQLYKEDVFYQYIQADYRGRLYYSESFLNFQGSDLSRGMLEFAKAKPMTSDGEWWLAVHTAGAFNQSYDIDEIPEWAEADYKGYLEDEGLDSISVDKFTLEDRVRWTNENMEVIIEAGRLKHIFPDAEKSVSFLACCIEWYNYSLARRDNRMYMSHLPIPIDGSNNGWQHLGAISKDARTGELVGLVAREIQRDFYVSTAKQLLEIDDPKLNAMPMKHVRKAISKRGSMTRAYSAGAAKIGENMWFDVRSEDFHETYDIDEEDCKGWAKQLIKAIDQVCPGPLDTMKYLQKLAGFEIGQYKKFNDAGEAPGKEYREAVARMKELYTTKDKTDEDLEELNDLVQYVQGYKSHIVYGNGSDRITWRTPSGFPVEYTNFRMDSKKCFGTISGYQPSANNYKIKHVALVPTKQPDVQGFMSGISPNYIHSMDASHMALIIDEWNGDFGAVHDSFSTHACDVDKLLDLTKSTFVGMYDVDNYYDHIRDQLLTNQDGLDVDQPSLGSLNIGGVYESDYFFA